MGPSSQGVPVSVARRMPWELHKETGVSALHRTHKDVMITAHILQILQMHLPDCMSDCVPIRQERASISVSEALIFLSTWSKNLPGNVWSCIKAVSS